jgi:hypothetical protein
MSSYHLLATWEGHCVPCDAERPLLLVEHGPRGLRAWLSGAGPEDRALSYTCGVCGRVEQVPLTEAEDAEYDATLARYPDWVEPPVLVDLTVAAQDPAPAVVEAGVEGSDVFSLAAALLSAAPVPAPVAPAAPRRPVVHVLTLPVQRVSATDDLPLALAVA